MLWNPHIRDFQNRNVTGFLGLSLTRVDSGITASSIGEVTFVVPTTSSAPQRDLLPLWFWRGWRNPPQNTMSSFFKIRIQFWLFFSLPQKSWNLYKSSNNPSSTIWISFYLHFCVFFKQRNLEEIIWFYLLIRSLPQPGLFSSWAS